MAAKGIYETVKQAVQDVIAPQLQELKGEMLGLRGGMRQVEKRMEEGFVALRNEIAYTTNKRMDEALDVRERLAALETKLSAHRS